jgi:hypothetical protein
MDLLMDALKQFDINFKNRWFCGSFLDPVWSNAIPPGHSIIIQQLQAQKQQYANQQLHQDLGGNQKKRAKLGMHKEQALLDFISATPLMEDVVPIPSTTRSLTMTLVQRINAPVSFPRLPSTNDTTSETICLNSAFASPHNCCMLRLCED